MGTEVEQNTVTTSSTTTTTSGPKTSMFAKKSGFVIPKNKLSGSLVPVFRGAKKSDGDSVNEETPVQLQRKSKWGPDLTQDTSVRKGRALAYQTRINQISQQLTLGALMIEDNQDSLSTPEFHDEKSSDHQLSTEEMEQLELERREIIGEILKLNPSYKTPANYKPLLKEAKVPIPIKEYPGFNFIGLVLGPASDTQKRLEKETGAKIRVYGTKGDTGGKVEVTPTDEKKLFNDYEDLYVHVSADTFEKIDAAVALIELLVTPVSVNPVSASSTSTAASDTNPNNGLSNSLPSSITITELTNQGMPQPYTGSLPPLQVQISQYSQAWFPPAGPTQSAIYPQSGLVTPSISSAALHSNPNQVSSAPFNPPNIPSLFGPRSVIAPSFSPVSQNPLTAPFRPQPPNPLQPSYMQQAPQLGQTGESRNTPVPILQSTTTQFSPVGPLPNVRPVISTLPQSTPLANFAGDSTGWLQSPMGISASHGRTNFMSMTPQVPSHGQNTLASPNMVFSGPRPVNVPNNMISPISGLPQSFRPGASQQSEGGFSVQPPMPQIAMRSPSLPFIPNSLSGSAPNSVSAVNPGPPQPNSSDFTYQPRRPPYAASQVSWQSNQPGHHHNIPPPTPTQTGQAPPLAHQPPLMRPVLHNLNSSPVQGFPRPQIIHPMDQPRPQIPMNFPPRHPGLLGPNAVSLSTGSHMQPRNFIPPHPFNNSAGPFPPKPGTQQNHPFGGSRPQMLPIPRQHFGNHPRNSSGVQQVYDPFSPTSASFNPRMGGNAAKAHDENDPEYEDLMASVGVK